MTLYARQLAWLYEVPRAEKKLSEHSANPVSRIEQMKIDKIEPDLPPLDMPEAIDWLMEVGPVESSGMDRVPIGWTTLAAWQDQTGIVLAPWQASLLRRLSSAFLAQARASEKPDCPAPWSARQSPERRSVVASMLRALFTSRVK